MSPGLAVMISVDFDSDVTLRMQIPVIPFSTLKIKAVVKRSANFQS